MNEKNDLKKFTQEHEELQKMLLNQFYDRLK